MSEDNKINWYKDLTSRANTLSEAFGLDDGQSSDLRNFVVSVAKDQYKTGNKFGAAWAFKQVREGTKNHTQPSTAV